MVSVSVREPTKSKELRYPLANVRNCTRTFVHFISERHLTLPAFSFQKNMGFLTTVEVDALLIQVRKEVAYGPTPSTREPWGVLVLRNASTKQVTDDEFG